MRLPFWTPVILCGALLAAGCKPTELDLDGDGYVASEDCDDDDWNVNPSANEVCNERDDDCDGEIDDGVLVVLYSDTDGDGYGSDEEVMACPGVPDTSTRDDDCDDSDADVHPKAEEVCGNGKDDDCDGEEPVPTWYADADDDGYGDPATIVGACTPPSGFVADATDCDDDDGSIHPNAIESCDGIDTDCDRGDDCVVSLADADVKYTGLAQDRAGTSVAGAGDVNGDGYSDIVVGATPTDHSSRPGAAYLVLGEPSPTSASLLDLDAAYTGESTWYTGSSVAAAGDVDGDTYDDFLIGDPDNRGVDNGLVYLILGGPSPTPGALSEVADAEYTGVKIDDWAAAVAGNAVAGAGDIDGDGGLDILVGAPSTTSTGSCGQMYVMSVGPTPASASLADADATYTCEASGDGAGNSVAAAGDVNGDGYDDFLAGAPRADGGAGAAYLVLGSKSPTSGALSDADAKYSGELDGYVGDANAARSIAGPGDVNGDTFDDILVGSPLTNAAYLILGGESPASASLETADAAYTGDDAVGMSVGGAGDLNGDGHPDLLVGSLLNIYVVLGGPLPASASVTTAFRSYAGEAPGDASTTGGADCFPVAGVLGDLDRDDHPDVFDVDGDGHPDIVVGAPGNDEGGADAGAAYVLLHPGL